MALSRVKTWSAEVLYAADLNAEFDNIIDNQMSYISPVTAAFDMDGFELILDADADSSITMDTDDQLDIKLNGADVFVFDGTEASPTNGMTFVAKATGSNPYIIATGTAGRDLEVRCIGTTDSVILANSAGAETLIATGVASAVNEVTITSATAGVTGPIIAATGDDTHLNLNIRSKGTGDVIIGDASGEAIATFADVSSAVNGVTVTNAAAGVTGPIIASSGQTNVNLNVRSAGTGDVILADSTGAEVLIAAGNASTPVNEITITNADASNNPTIASTGTTDNTGIDFEQKDGDELLILESVDAAENEITITNAASGNRPKIDATGQNDRGIEFRNAEGEEILILQSSATSVNEVTITSASTTNAPSIATTGGDTNIPLEFKADSLETLALKSVGSATTYLDVTNATTGTGPIISSDGETDVDVRIKGKGTGTVKLGDAELVFPDSDGAESGYVLQTDSAGTLSFAQAAGLPRGYLSGLAITRSGATQFQVAPGTCRDSTNAVDMTIGTNWVKEIASGSYAEGNGSTNDGFEAGYPNSFATSTSYHVFVIQKSDGTTDVFGDTSSSATNRPGTFTYFRRIGSFTTESGTATNMLADTRDGDTVIYSTVIDEGATVTGTEAQSVVVTVPSGVLVTAIVNVVAGDADAGIINIHSIAGDSGAATTANGLANLAFEATGQAGGQFRVLTNTSAQVGYRSTNSSLDTFEVGTVGYIDRRGRDD